MVCFRLTMISTSQAVMDHCSKNNLIGLPEISDHHMNDICDIFCAVIKLVFGITSTMSCKLLDMMYVTSAMTWNPWESLR